MKYYYENYDKRAQYRRKYRQINKIRLNQSLKCKARTPNYRYTSLKKQAKRSNKELNIPFDYYLYLLECSCYYCGEKLNPTGSGIDRFDNNKGYTISNAVACCFRCNLMKRELSANDFISHIKKVINHQEWIEPMQISHKE